jgi:hypothetical protein
MSRVFDGTNDNLSTSSPPVTAPPFTLALWTKRTAAGVDDVCAALGVSGSADNFWRIGWFVGNNNYLRARDTANGDAIATGTTTSTAWIHICGVETSSSSRAAFRNGGNKGTNATTIAPTGIDLLRIGESASGVQDYDGKIAHVAIWNIALSDGEVASLGAGANPLAIQAANLVAYWPLTDSSLADVVSALTLTATGTTTDDADNPTVDPPPGSIIWPQYQHRHSTLITR